MAVLVMAIHEEKTVTIKQRGKRRENGPTFPNNPRSLAYHIIDVQDIIMGIRLRPYRDMH